MLIDDAKGALAALKAEMQEDRRIKSGTDLNVGDIVYQDMDRNDGLVLNKGYDDRLKFFVIVGKNSKGDAIGLCLINSDLDFYKDVPDMQRFQYILKARKSVAVKAERVGHLTADDEAEVLPLVASCGFIDAHMRKVYRIGQK